MYLFAKTSLAFNKSVCTVFCNVRKGNNRKMFFIWTNIMRENEILLLRKGSCVCTASVSRMMDILRYSVARFSCASCRLDDAMPSDLMIQKSSRSNSSSWWLIITFNMPVDRGIDAVLHWIGPESKYPNLDFTATDLSPLKVSSSTISQ